MDPSRSFLVLIALPELSPDWVDRVEADVLATLGETFDRDERIPEGIAGAVGDEHIRIVGVAEPIPEAVLAGPRGGAWYWPEAEAQLSGHHAHVIAAVKGPLDASPVMRALVLTRLTTLLLLALDGIGVLWAGAPAVHSAEAFQASSADMAPDSLPIRLWVDFQVWKNDDDTHSLRTNGMQPFGRHEIEIHGSTKDQNEVASWAYNVAHYILETGTEVEDGHAVGKSPSEWIRVHLIPSVFDAEKTVYYLDLEAEE
jgi:hypothetical protein